MFLSKLAVEVQDKQLYILTKDLVWSSKDLKITVKTGFDFDGASIPRSLWGLIGSPMSGRYVRAACLHDLLYSIEYKNDRKLCDDLFLEAMKADGVSYTQRYAIYWAVRSAGWVVWSGHNKEEVKENLQFFSTN